jgi:hypothetical protein
MEKIDPSDLLGNGYTEESGWERDFGKAYCWPKSFSLCFVSDSLQSFEVRAR